MTTQTEAFASVADMRAVAEKVVDVAKVLSAATDATKKQTNDLTARVNGIEGELAKRPGGGPGYGAGGPSLGEAVIRHSDFGRLSRLSNSRGRATITVKAMITTLPDSGGALIPSDKRPELAVILAQQRLTIRDLIMPGETRSSSIEYPNQTVRDIHARVVSEGGLKPESNFAFEGKTANVRTIAHWTKISKQALDDAPLLRSILDSELRYGLKLAEELELLFGDGTGVHLFGIVPQATPYDQADDNTVANEQRLDTLHHAITQSEVALLPATGIVLNDADARGLQLIKDSTGQYLLGGPSAPPLNSLWGIPTVRTPAMPIGKFLVGAFRDGSQIFDREDVNVEVATESEDDFLHNLAVVRCEERLALAVKRPGAFRYGEFPAYGGSGT